MESANGSIPIHETIRHITRILLSENDIDKGVNRSLEVLQGATKVDRVYIFELWQEEKRGYVGRQVFEYCATGVEPQIDNPELIDFEMEPGFTRWMEHFNTNSWISGDISLFPEFEKEILSSQGILTILVIPVKVENNLVGFMGFDSTTSKREWRDDEVELLIESSVLIGTMLLRRRQEKKIVSDELKYTELFARMSDGVVYHASSGEIVHFNQAACTILGMTPDQLLGKTSLDKRWRAIREDGSDFGGEEHPAMITLRTGEPVTGVTMGIFDDHHHDYRWISIISIPDVDKTNGKLLGVFVIFRDITSLILQEQQVKKAKKIAEDVSKLKSSIIANIGHEFRTPITGIMGFANLISDQSEDPNILDAARSIGQSANRLHHTLESLLEYSYLDSNAIEYRPKHIVLSAALRAVLEETREHANDKLLEFSYDFIGDDVVFCDERYLKTIARQLLNNALKFTEKGRVTFEFRVNENSFVMTVTDTGIGISDDQHSYLFEPFVQGSGGVGRGFEGSGLGLPIVKRLVENLNGTIHIDSSAHRGSVFTVSIPRLLAKESGNSVAMPSIRTPEISTILYVEDNPVLRKLATSILGHYDLVCVPNAENALKFLDTNDVGLFLIDINLGTGMNGIEFARILREHPKYESARLVAITAYSLDQIDEDGGKGLFDHYISKPFIPEDLLTLVKSIVSRSGEHVYK